jgi:uncharacterized protein YndB with AHSA1/START domain
MRKHEMEIEISAPASKVWKVLTTAEGIAAWFAPGASVEPGAGGKMTISWGEGMEVISRIAIWKPERHRQIATDRPEPAPPSVIDYFIEGRGGATVLRLVHSGFGASADFDAEYESTGYGWPIFMKLLKHGAERGIDSCRNVTIMRMLSESPETAWEKLVAQAAGEMQGGVERHRDSKGHCAIEFPSQRSAMLSLFCDGCGGATAVTVMWLLYDVSAKDADAVRDRWTALLGPRVRTGGCYVSIFLTTLPSTSVSRKSRPCGGTSAAASRQDDCRIIGLKTDDRAVR